MRWEQRKIQWLLWYFKKHLDDTDKFKECLKNNLEINNRTFYLIKNNQKLPELEKELDEEKKKNELLTQQLEKYLGNEELMAQIL